MPTGGEKVFDRRITLKMTEEMYHDLKEEARLLDISMSDLIRLAIGNFLFDA